MEFHFQGVPALTYQYEQFSPAQLDSLIQNANSIIARVEEAKKGGAIISTLMSRLNNHQYVRCTSQSVQVTAASRYNPTTIDMDLHSLDITAFMGIITYLPLPLIRSLLANHAASERAAAIFENKPVDPRWTVYFSRLTFVNEYWASLFLQEVQTRLASSDTTSASSGNASFHIPGTTLLQSSDPTLVNSRQSIARDQLAHVENAPECSDTKSSSHSTQLSEDILLQVIKAKSSAWGPEHPTTIDSMLILVTSYISQKDYNKAKASLEQALHVCDKSHAPDSPELARVTELMVDVDEHLVAQRSR